MTLLLAGNIPGSGAAPRKILLNNTLHHRTLRTDVIPTLNRHDTDAAPTARKEGQK